MSIDVNRRESGSAVIGTAVVVLVTGVVFATATPRFVSAVREYRVSVASRQLTDLIHRAKTEAVADNRKVAIRLDTANNRAGVVVYNDDGSEMRTEYVPLPQGVTFQRPQSAGAPVSGAPSDQSVSFGLKAGSTTVYEQKFNSRGVPVVTSPTAVHALYIGNGSAYRAVTLTSSGGIRSWKWTDGHWTSTRTPSPSSRGTGDTPMH